MAVTALPYRTRLTGLPEQKKKVAMATFFICSTGKLWGAVYSGLYFGRSPRRASRLGRADRDSFRKRQSISSCFVSLPNVKEKDVKGLLFRKHQGTDVDFRLPKLTKHFKLCPQLTER